MEMQSLFQVMGAVSLVEHRFYSGRHSTLYQRTYACTLLDARKSKLYFPHYTSVCKIRAKQENHGVVHVDRQFQYIVMNDLAKFEFVYSDEMFDTYTPTFKSLTESIQANELENEHLSDFKRYYCCHNLCPPNWMFPK